MANIANLLNLGSRVYVYFQGGNLTKLFLQRAEMEGFTWADGAKPTERKGDGIISIRPDWTINTLGWAGHMLFHNTEAENGDSIVRVDYGKYLVGSKDYLYKKPMSIKNTFLQ